MEQAAPGAAAPAAPAAAAGAAPRCSGWRLVPCALDGTLQQLPRGDKRVALDLAAGAPTLLGRNSTSKVRRARVRRGAACSRCLRWALSA